MVALIREEKREKLGVAEMNNSLGFHLLIGRESSKGLERAISMYNLIGRFVDSSFVLCMDSKRRLYDNNGSSRQYTGVVRRMTLSRGSGTETRTKSHNTVYVQVI